MAISDDNRARKRPFSRSKRPLKKVQAGPSPQASMTVATLRVGVVRLRHIRAAVL